jgi:hypothetical protein
MAKLHLNIYFSSLTPDQQENAKPLKDIVRHVVDDKDRMFIGRVKREVKVYSIWKGDNSNAGTEHAKARVRKLAQKRKKMFG